MRPRPAPRAPRGGGAPRTWITFLTDYGLQDEFVGVCHAVIARIAPRVRVIDLAHGVRGVRAGAAVLAQSVPFCPEAVHLAVVDPGVGTARRGVVVVSGSGAPLVGPDNGLLLPAAERLGGPAAAFELQNPAHRLEPVSATFHGRDVFAPAAAHLALGVDPADLGPPVDPADLVRLPPPRVEVGAGRLLSEVLRWDAFGNLQLAATGEDLAAAGLGPRVGVVVERGRFPALVGRTFADAPPGALVVYVDAGGHASVAVNLGRAVDVLGAPQTVLVERAD